MQADNYTPKAYIGTDSTGPFGTEWTFWSADDLLVRQETISTGVFTTLVLNVDYTVTGGLGSSGTVTTNVEVPGTDRLWIERREPITQTKSWANQRSVDTTEIEKADDKLTRLIQVIQETVDRCFKADVNGPTITWDDIAEAVTSAAASAVAAEESASDALAAQGAAEGAQKAAEDAQAATEVALASAGIPTIGGNGGKPLFAKVDESGMEYLSASDARDSLGLGTAAVEGVGTAPGNVVQLDEEGKLPAVDGSALTGLGVVAPGTVLAFAGSTPPEGYLECDGAALSRTAYAALYAAIGTAFGAGDGSTTFNLPDLRGEFVRGWDHGRGVDAGRALGSAQADALQNITGAVTGVVMSGASAASGAFAATLTQSGIINGGTSWTHKTLTLDASSVARTASETRPRNVALMFIIKY